MERDQIILSLRPDINHQSENQFTIEGFQNFTLRPILKIQHELNINLLIREKNFRKQIELCNDNTKAQLLIKDYCLKDKNFRHKLIGVIIALMTMEEFKFYSQNKQAADKRIITMQIKRYTDSLSEILC